MIPVLYLELAGGFWPPIWKICSSNWVHLPQFWGKHLTNTVFMIHHPHSNSPEAPGSFETHVAPFDAPFREGDLSNHKFRGLVAMHQQIPEWDAKIVSLPGGCQVSHLSTFFGCKKRPICFFSLSLAVVFSQSHFQLKILGLQNWVRIWYPNNIGYEEDLCSKYAVGLMWNQCSLQSRYHICTWWVTATRLKNIHQVRFIV